MKLPKSYIKKYGISKEAWREYKKSLKRKTPKKKVIRVERSTTRRKPMARRRRYRRKRKYTRSKKIPIAPTAGLIFSILSPAPGTGNTLIQSVQSGDFAQFAYDAREKFTGIDNEGKFRFDWLISTYAPIFAGILVHKIMGALGANRYFSNIPLIGKYLSI